MTSIKDLKIQKNNLQQIIDSDKESIKSLKEKLKDLETADQNVDAILHMQVPEKHKEKSNEPER